MATDVCVYCPSACEYFFDDDVDGMIYEGKMITLLHSVSSLKREVPQGVLSPRCAPHAQHSCPGRRHHPPPLSNFLAFEELILLTRSIQSGKAVISREKQTCEYVPRTAAGSSNDECQHMNPTCSHGSASPIFCRIAREYVGCDVPAISAPAVEWGFIAAQG